MSDKTDFDFSNFNGIGNGDFSRTLPVQAIPQRKKTLKWKKATMDALEQEGIRQIKNNIRFSAFRKMMNGSFTYVGCGVDEMEMTWFDKEVRKLRSDAMVSTYIKHFDFIGIIVNALSGIYSDYEDKFTIDSRDEYSTNEFIRQKTEKLHQYAVLVFNEEIKKLLLMRGIDVNKQDFTSQEEAQSYQQQVQQQVQALTPDEIQRSLSKNFKVLATEWAQNTIEEDNGRFDIKEKDAENFIDYILSGRYFKHFGVGYDNYFVERWSPEETFFSQDVDAKYPQNGEYAGRVVYMSASNILNRFGHLMTNKEQESIANYWNISENYSGVEVDSKATIENTVFPKPTIVPFHNYFDHQANVQLEDALGIPLGRTTFNNEEGEEVTVPSYIPRMDEQDYIRGNYSSELRDDIEVRKDTIRVTEVYWRSSKRLGVLIHENDLGTPSVDLVTDDLLEDFLSVEEIKKLRNVSIQELQTALKEDRISEYLNTITYLYAPEVWKGVKIKGNSATLKKDLYLDVRPLDYQIRGSESKLFDVLLPVAGIIDNSIISKVIPYQQLHNISMNQITDLLEKELGVFFTFDITAFPDEFRDETTEESIFKAREIIKDTALLGLDASRQNTNGNITPANLFQRHEVVFATQVQYRWTLAQQYKQEALSQIGLTPQILGAPNNYTTAEGVKQGAQASYALINPIFDKMTSAKAKELELHIAVAQYCQANGKDQTVMYRKGDGELRFLDIMAEDGELFPLRWLGVTPSNSSKDRKIVEQLKQFIMTDNTVAKTMTDAIDILTNPALIELKDIALNIEKKSKQQQQEQRQYESDQIDKQIQANQQQQDKELTHEVLITQMKIDGDIQEAKIQAYGKLEDNNIVDATLLDRIDNINKKQTDDEFRSQEIGIKQAEVDRKTVNDAENRKAKLDALSLKAQELALKKQSLDTQKFTSIINKN